MFVAIVKRDLSIKRMKKSMITWHVFRAALKVQTANLLESWLGRWWFADAGVYSIDQDSSSIDLRVSAIRREQGTRIPRFGNSQISGGLGQQNPPAEPSRLMGTNRPTRGHSFREL